MSTDVREPAASPSAICRQFLLSDIPAGTKVLDIGCGDGDMISELQNHGIIMAGVEYDAKSVARCQGRGMEVIHGCAENLPFPEASFDGIICSVVIPYTDERRAISEWARVLKPGGFVRATYHGIGFALHYLACGVHGWKSRAYGARMLLNTSWYGMTRRRLPGFLGDTLCQLPKRLSRNYRDVGLTLQREIVASHFVGVPEFFGHALMRNGHEALRDP
ncbi:MAG: class I SAM-dependent methyltransferase [Planctomycetaceae bacterium]